MLLDLILNFETKMLMKKLYLIPVTKILNEITKVFNKLMIDFYVIHFANIFFRLIYT